MFQLGITLRSYCRRGLVVAVAILLVLGSAMASEGARPKSLTVVADSNYPPYIFNNAAGSIEGYTVDTWKLWEQKTGIRVNLVATDWSKAQELLVRGEADVIDPIFQTPEREKSLAFSESYAEVPVPIYVHREIGGITGVNTLRGFLVGVKAGDACIDWLRAEGITTLKQYDSYQQLVDGAASHEVKVFCLDEPPANYLLYRSGVSRDYRKAFVAYDGQFHRAVKLNNAALLPLLQQGFDAFSDAEKQALQDKWLGEQLDLTPWGEYLSYGLAAALLLGLSAAAWGWSLHRRVQRRTFELRNERGMLRTLIDTLPDLIWLKDPNGVYLACNKEFELFFGAGQAEIIGRTDHDFIDKELADFFLNKDREAIAKGGRSVNEEEITYASDGRRVLLETIKTPMFDAGGELIGVLGIGRDITSRRAAEKAAREVQDRFQVAFHVTPVAASITRARDGLYIDANERYIRQFGWSREEIMGHTSTELGIWPDKASRDAWLQKLQETGSFIDYETSWLNRQGIQRRVRISAELTDLHGEPHIFTYIVDITERAIAEEELRLAAQVYENTAEGIIITDSQGKIVAVNRAFTDITGYGADEVRGLEIDLLRSDCLEPDFYKGMWNTLVERGLWQGEIWNRRKNGDTYPEWLTISAVRDNGKTTHYVFIFSDITAIKHSQEALNFLAHHDPLTALPNRVLLNDRLEHALERARRERGSLAVLFIDLDRFKQINDSLGHSVGDEILRAAAQTMKGIIRASDTVARLGGDEFVVILEDEGFLGCVTTVAHKLVERFAQPFEVAGRELYVTASVGISVFPSDGEDADTLLKHADLAMYKAKEQGRNTFHFYEAAMGAGALERLIVENALRGAVQRNELLLHYQPQVDLATGALAGVEALVRWKHPELGLVLPGQFIPVAEEMGLIGEIGAWVLQEACRQMGAWYEEGFVVPRVAVNLSMQQLEGFELVKLTEQLLEKWKLPPGWLELEVTESVIMRQTDRVVKILEGLRELGVYLAVDDFGTGYSSLGYLRQLPVHRLKIDHSFVQDIGRDANDEMIARAIIGLGRSLGLEVVAEGVEREEQAAFLQQEGCRIAQGYLFARPLPPEAVQATWQGGCVSRGRCEKREGGGLAALQMFDQQHQANLKTVGP